MEKQSRSNRSLLLPDDGLPSDLHGMWSFMEIPLTLIMKYVICVFFRHDKMLLINRNSMNIYNGMKLMIIKTKKPGNANFKSSRKLLNNSILLFTVFAGYCCFLP